ncbi:MAG: hypothetical protein ACFFCQ_09395 [Promethearchaeota archaeon]
MPSTLEKLPSLLQLIVRTIEKTIPNLHLKEKTGPSIKTRKGVYVLSYNFFSKDIELDFRTLITSIEKSIPTKGTEVIAYSGTTGHIKDQGQLSFEIQLAELRDIYTYEEGSFCYLRLLIERSLEGDNRRWISLDVDFIALSPWFMA